MPDWLAAALVAAVFSGVGSYAAVGVHLKWLRADVNRIDRSSEAAHERLDALPCQLGRRGYDRRACVTDHQEGKDHAVRQ